MKYSILTVLFTLFSTATAIANAEIAIDYIEKSHSKISTEFHTFTVKHVNHFFTDEIIITNVQDTVWRDVIILASYDWSVAPITRGVVAKEISLFAIGQVSSLTGENLTSDIPGMNLKGNKIFIRIISSLGETKVALEIQEDLSYISIPYEPAH